MLPDEAGSAIRAVPLPGLAAPLPRTREAAAEDGARPPWTPAGVRHGGGRGSALSMDAAVELPLGRASPAMDAAVELPPKVGALPLVNLVPYFNSILLHPNRNQI